MNIKPIIPKSTAPEPIVSVQKVTFDYLNGQDNPPVLEEVTLEIPDNDFLGLIGPNGGGKTTLLKILLGVEKPCSGTVHVLGRHPREVSSQIGYVPQHAQIDASVPATVLDVVLTGCLGRSPWGVRYGRKHIDAARAAMAQVGVEDLRKRSIGMLSGGQRQRVLIARAMAADAKILLLDEPLAGVDLHMEKGILELLHTLNARLPIVLVSHDLGFVSAHVKRVACLNRRLVVHRPDEITGEVIGEMYHSHGPVLQVRHDNDCPIEHDGGRDGEVTP
ncbi:MAG: ABC transporter ATP-binding protein [Planctomycetota bacterium]